MSESGERRDLLFLCVANSARSQLAEGIARSLAPPEVGVHSAGSAPGKLHPLAVQALAEIGIDISKHVSKEISRVPLERIATAITLCAEEVCPVFPGEVGRLHWPTADPAAPSASEHADIAEFRRARDQIGDRLRDFFVSEQRADGLDLDDLDAAQLSARFGEKWNTYDSDVLPAWVAEMDYPLAAPIREVLARAIADSDLGYPISPRATGVISAFANRMRERFEWQIDDANTEVISDVVQGIYLSLRAFADGRDGVIVQTPIYPPFLRAVRETGMRLVENRLVATNSTFEIDFAALHAAADAETGFLLLCNPHNPTGRVLTQHELEGLAELVLERDLTVISDEIHSDLVYPGAQHLPFASLSPEIAARTITLNSASKAFNVPGLRCAIAHFGSRELRRRFNQSTPSRARGGVGILGLSATLAAWERSDPWLDQVRSYLAGNRMTLMREVARRFPGIVLRAPQASYLAWLDCTALELPETPGRFFHDHGRLALSEGRLFGADLESHVRLNFATSHDLLGEALDRMQTALDSRR